MADQQYCLRWNNHQNTLISVFDSLQERGCMVDCTLGAEGKSLQAHKVVLSACSPYLEDLLTKHYDKHPILILKDVRFEELKAMVDYMYRGEVNVAHDKLNTFLQAAESLQIKGLSDSRNDPPDTGGTAGGTKRTSKGAPVSVRSSQQLTVRSTNLADESRDGSVSPSQRKRRRRRGSEESETDSSSNVADGKQSSAAVAPVTGPSILNQDLLPSVPASGPADALLSSIMESAETETAPDSGIFTNAVTPSSQENVIQDKGSSDILIEPKTEYLDDDTQDLPLGDDDSGPGPSHSRSGNFMNDSDMFMADQDGTNAQDAVLVKEEDYVEYRLWFGDAVAPASPRILRSPRSASAPVVRPCFVRLEDVSTHSVAAPRGEGLATSQFYGSAASAKAKGPSRPPLKDRHRSASPSPRPPSRSRSRSTAPDRSRSRSTAADRNRSRSTAPDRSRTAERDKSKSRRSASCSRRMGTPRIALGKGKAKAKDEVLRCGLCLMAFHLHSSLRKHVQGHQERTPDRCLVCGKGVAALGDAVLHFLSHSEAADDLVDGDLSAKCRLCPVRFSRRRRGNLVGHVRKHTGEKPFKCASCHDVFRTNSQRLVHAQRIHGSRDACTSKAAALVQRVRRRHDAPASAVTCFYCPAQLASLDELKEHAAALHGAARPHACKLCPRRFPARAELVRHEATHSTGFKCSACGLRFGNPKDCLQHVSKAHRGRASK